SKKNEKLLVEITKRFFLTAEKEQLDVRALNNALTDVKRIFEKDPKNKDDACQILQKERLDLENHHIAGKFNSEITVTICVDCHIHIGIRQLLWNSSWNLANNPENMKSSFVLQGVQEIFIEKHFKTGIRDYRLLADSLSSTIKHYQEI
ncbi:MAG: hypothetical protein ABR981_05950, partial [Candidatus Micrarchaeaceae archaeon]